MELTVNGKARSVDVEPDATLLNVLREQLDLTGPKYGCGEGQCGACTVLIDGKPRRACITPVKAAAGRQVTTVEGLERNGRLHPLQQAFLDLDVMQCGYCTPGMIVTGAALLAANPSPSEQEIIRFMQGNICRCGTYQRIVAAIRKAASAKAG
jgi:aerobic-type carbon monoxide dehydrogenase small subunit (CoxS/CutS family)